MALPNSQLNTIYWLPWYNNVDLDTQLRFGNVSSNVATVHVYVGGPGNGRQSLHTSTRRKRPPELCRREQWTGQDPERSKYRGSRADDLQSQWHPTSFTEMMALPDSQLNTTYWLPWYNNVDLDTQLRFGNVSNNAATCACLYWWCGNGRQSVHLGTGESKPELRRHQQWSGQDRERPKSIVAAERVIYKVNGLQTSFTEMMALPDSQLNTTYWLPWYNNVDLDTQLRFGIP